MLVRNNMGKQWTIRAYLYLKMNLPLSKLTVSFQFSLEIMDIWQIAQIRI